MPIIFDTCSAHYLLDENDNHGLKYLTKKYLKKNVVEYDEAIKYGINSKEFYEYGMEDAINTYLLFQQFSPEIEKQNLHRIAYDIEFPFTKVLMELNINGIGADAKRAKEMQYEVQHLYYQIENELLEYFGGCYKVWITPRSRVLHCEPSINFNSTKQVVPLVESLGFEITERSDKSKEKAWNKQAKDRLKGRHPIIDLLLKFSKVEKLLNGFLIPFERFIDEDGRIRCSFNNTVAVTGRLSCSNPNIEQLPKNNDIANIRDLFISTDDKCFIVADYSGQELRILGEESRDKNLKEAFERNYDLHLATANDVNKLGLTVQQLTDKTPEHDEAAKLYKKYRDNAKCINFGIAYGKSSYGFSIDFRCSEDEAQKFIDQYFNTYPTVKLRMENCNKQVYLNGYVANMHGRRRRFPDFHKMWEGEQQRCYRQAFNFLIQSVGADVVKAACIEIIKDIKLKIVNIVHDEVVIECAKSYVEEGMRYIRHCMLSALPMSIPWDITIDSGRRYGECK